MEISNTRNASVAGSLRISLVEYHQPPHRCIGSEVEVDYVKCERRKTTKVLAKGVRSAIMRAISEGAALSLTIRVVPNVSFAHTDSAAVSKDWHAVGAGLKGAMKDSQKTERAPGVGSGLRARNPPQTQR